MKKILFIALIAGAAVLGACTKCYDKPVNDDCIDESKINRNALCTKEYKPVCGCDGKTYGNDCEATNAGVKSWKEGACGVK